MNGYGEFNPITHENLRHLQTERRQTKCQEETEQDREVKELERVEAVVAVDKEEEAEAREEVLRQGRGAIAFARAVAKEPPMNWVLHVMSKNAPNAAML